ncbi:enoyl-CoA hydratase/isomerase family protein [Ramlibacter tataouinensis]|uniref:enoyl-CoA hydratase/isomerase family protein n=1 Tax=Ramlibacter tataouinensis TaxID=94132 RepID=UPI0022F3E566|nr:enoyl-CoA hydratase/isomerase family protein [Ramlibacter tataouinensis]WBY02351.1 enoyl-CoA hydratase/isomerase family protein [Ramlibacter tataouinensis]
MPGKVWLESQGPVARVRLSHPGKLNAMSRAMWRELRATFLRLQDDPAVRCVVVQGEGGAFCAGGDISEYADFRFDEASLRDFHEQDVWGALQAMLDCDVPLLAGIAGACMGAGMEIASCCDIRIAADDASFGAPIARLGFPMAPREAELVARAAGEGTARQMLLEAAVLDAAEMKARGFLQHLAPPADLPARCNALAARIASLAPQAARLNKRTLRALRERHDPERAGAAAAELAAAYRYAPAAEHREGVAAFLDKRKPQF